MYGNYEVGEHAADLALNTSEDVERIMEAFRTNLHHLAGDTAKQLYALTEPEARRIAATHCEPKNLVQHLENAIFERINATFRRTSIHWGDIHDE